MSASGSRSSRSHESVGPVAPPQMITPAEKRLGLVRVYLTPAEVAEQLAVSEKTVYRWAKDLSMPVVRVGGVLRFHSQRLEAWLRAREQRPRSRKLRLQAVKSGRSEANGADCA